MDSVDPDQTQVRVAEAARPVPAVGWEGSAPATAEPEPVTGFEGLAGSSANWISRSWRISSAAAAQRSFEIESCRQIAAAVAAVAAVVVVE